VGLLLLLRLGILQVNLVFILIIQLIFFVIVIVKFVPLFAVLANAAEIVIYVREDILLYDGTELENQLSVVILRRIDKLTENGSSASVK
jgi:hypothetical protein